MSDLQARLDRALDAGAAPARDAMFRIEVLRRRERAELLRRLRASAALALGAAVLAAAGYAAIDQLGPGPERLALLAAGAAALAALLAEPHLGALSALRRAAARWWTRA